METSSAAPAARAGTAYGVTAGALYGASTEPAAQTHDPKENA